MSAAQPALRTYVTVYLLLLAGLAATLAASYAPLGLLNVPIMLAIAFAKATLVVLYFMHVRYSPRLTWLVVVAGLVWLAILLAFVLSDYRTRAWVRTREPASLAPAAQSPPTPAPDSIEEHRQ